MFQLLTSPVVGGTLVPQVNEGTGELVLWEAAHTAEWVGRNAYGQGHCRAWRVVDCATGAVVACYPTADGYDATVRALAAELLQPIL